MTTKTATKTKSKLEEYPVEAFQLPYGEVLLAEHHDSDNEDGKQPFEIIAYSGAIIENHWMWGNLVIDMGGVSLGRKDKPILRDHFEIVGWTTHIEKKGGEIRAKGFFTPVTEAGTEVIALAKDGFPWQASARLVARKIERVPPGDTATVNGHTLTGPGTIFRTSVLREISVTAVGADEATKAAVLSEGSEKILVETDDPERDAMTSPEAATAEKPDKTAELSKEAPKGAATLSAEDRAAIVEEGRKDERKRIANIREIALSGQDEVVKDLIEKGTSVADASLALLADAKTRKTALLTSLETDSPPSAGTDDPERFTENRDGAASEKSKDAKAAWLSLTDDERAGKMNFAVFEDEWDRENNPDNYDEEGSPITNVK